MLNRSTIISLTALVLLGIGVSRIKYEVLFLRKTLKNSEKELERLRDNFNVLSAEWSYLNAPKRLKKLCEKYLKDMRPIENSQIMNYSNLNKYKFSIETSDIKESFDTFINNSLDKKW
ncbi:MAG: hypothetical protein LBF70_01595 [Holosporales bacterium]|jgi:hypothetical protein|nr:hypothetical protein [Holosporales bacterium]